MSPEGDAAARISTAEGLFGHVFAKPALLREALTHRSAMAGRARVARRAKSTGHGSNERLEFLGDRVLGLVIAEWLAERFPGEQEGELGQRFAVLVSRETVAEAAAEAGLADCLIVGPNEALAGVARLATVLADAMEAALGALFIDGGLVPARDFIRRTWRDRMVAQIVPPKDPKTALQERLAARGKPAPVYRVISREGPSHAPHFVMTAEGAGRTGTGQGTTKRTAERAAAIDLLGQLK